MKYVLTMICLLSAIMVHGQKHEDNQQLEIDLAPFNAVHIYNTGGDIHVTSWAGNSAELDVQRTLKAATKEKLERAISEIYIDKMVVGDELYIFIQNPFKKLEKGNRNDGYMYYKSWNQDYSTTEEIGIEFNFDMKIKLPASTNLVVSNHRGKLLVDGIKGRLAAFNHHDGVSVTKAENVTYAHSHHGDVEVQFANQPTSDIEFDTHHGDIKVSFPQTPSADVELDSYHGSFFTDFDWSPAPPKVEKTKSKNKAKYKIGSKTRISMGDGGHRLTFESHHGDMYILKN